MDERLNGRSKDQPARRYRADLQSRSPSVLGVRAVDVNLNLQVICVLHYYPIRISESQFWLSTSTQITTMPFERRPKVARDP